MAKFIKHEPCPKCGSRDNLARYSDGSAFCFGCRYSERGGISGFVAERTQSGDDAPSDEIRTPVSETYSEVGVRWLGKYGVTVEEAIRRGIIYNGYFDQLIFPFYGRDGRLVCYQGRNLNSERAAKAKYYNVGDAQEATSVYQTQGSGFPKRLVITEDALSAIRIARQCDAIPALGTHVPVSRIIALAPSYEVVTVWLDSDKWREARTIAENFQWLGLSANTIFTELDPKDYSDVEIKKYLTSGT